MPDEINSFVHQFVPGDPGSTRTLLLLHGTGGSETDLLLLGPDLAPGAALISPRGKVSEHGMARFFRRHAEGVLDVEDLHERTHELAGFVEAAAAWYEFDQGNIVAVGFSNGANIATSTLLLRPDLLSGAVLFRPMVPFEPDDLPDLSGVPVFIGSGREDPLVPQPQAERLEAMLRDAGSNVTLNWQPGGHQLTMDDIGAARAWLESR